MAFYRITSNLKRAAAPALARFVHREEPVLVYGLKINTVQAGEGPRGLLLLPGALGTAKTDFYRQFDQLPVLLPDYKIVAWDPPGNGSSTPHQRTSCSDIFVDDANAAIDLMQTLKVGFFSVLGWNAGGTTALVMAGRFPQFVDKVVVWGTSAYFSLKELKKLDEFRTKLTKDAFGSIYKPLEMLYGQDCYSRRWQKHVEELSKIIRARDGDFCKTEVDCIQAPTLIVHGARDPVISKEHPQYLCEHIKRAEYYEIGEGGHDLHIRCDDQFNKTVSKFLARKNK